MPDREFIPLEPIPTHVQHTPGNTFLPHPIRGEETVKQRRLFMIVGIAAVVSLLIGALAYGHFSSSRHTSAIAYDPVTLQPKQPTGFFQQLAGLFFHPSGMLGGETDDRVNILLLGIGGPGHDGPYLTDTIMIASVKPSTNQVALISIPRDLLVNMPGFGPHKINAANAFGESKTPGAGAAYATQVIEETFGTHIPYYVRVDFQAFERIIDTVGGVTVDVERTFVDTSYPLDELKYQTVSFTKGTQTLNGKNALIYSRSRHGNNNEGSDFARAKRQQKILVAVKEKILSAETLMNPVRINEITDTLSTHVNTNIEFADLVRLLKIAKGFQGEQIKNMVFDTSEGNFLEEGHTLDGAFILQPKSGSFAPLKQVIANIFVNTTTPTATSTNRMTVTPITPLVQKTIESATGTRIEIDNGTWIAGLAAQVKHTLEQQHIPVLTIGNTATRPMEKSAIYARSGTPTPIMKQLTEALQISFTPRLPDTMTIPTSTDILVILGEDYSAIHQ